MLMFPSAKNSFAPKSARISSLLFFFSFFPVSSKSSNMSTLGDFSPFLGICFIFQDYAHRNVCQTYELQLSDLNPKCALVRRTENYMRRAEITCSLNRLQSAPLVQISCPNTNRFEHVSIR